MPITATRDLNLSSLGPAITDAILIRAGVRLRTSHPRARQFGGLPFKEMCLEYLRHLGVDVRRMALTEAARTCLSRSRMLRATSGVALAQSTPDFANLLTDAMQKSLRIAHGQSAPTWRQWCRHGEDLPTLKALKIVGISGFGDASEIPEGAPYTFVGVPDTGETLQMVKSGMAVAITKEALINDDMAAFRTFAEAAIAACNRRQDDLVYGLLGVAAGGQVMAEDSKALFHSDHGNVATTAALTAAELGKAESLMAAQVGPGGEKLNIRAKFLLVPPLLRVTADQLCSSTLLPAPAEDAGEPYAGLLHPVSEPRLGAIDANGWWLVAHWKQIDTIETRFLKGEQVPVVEQTIDFDSDTHQFKARQTFGARVIDWRGFVFNAGGS